MTRERPVLRPVRMTDKARGKSARRAARARRIQRQLKLGRRSLR